MHISNQPDFVINFSYGSLPRCHPQLHQRLRRLQAQQAAAEDGGATGGLGTRDDGILGEAGKPLSSPRSGMIWV